MAEVTEAVEIDNEENSDSGPDDVEMAATGINILLNNGFDEAQALFEKYKDDSPLMHAGFSFVYFMQALISFEQDKLAEALKILQTTEKMCETGEGFMASFKKRFRKKKKHGLAVDSENKIQRHVIIADTLLYQAILAFTNQDFSGYLKGGWYLRKAWKLLEKLHKEVVALQEKKTLAKIQQMSQSLSNTKLNSDNSDLNKDDSIIQDGILDTNDIIDANDNELTDEVICRLLGAVNFGYGTFQLSMSMVPPKVLKLIEFLGFEADRDAGLAALMYCTHSKDMKAPLAVLGLLWYHTVLRPFFALDGANRYSAGIKDAEDIISQNESSFPSSSLFLYFRGRIHRLKKENDLALIAYKKAQDESKGQREIELMCLYEIAWCNLLKLNWDTCYECLARLLKETKWSKAYYSYLMALCLGSKGDLEKCHQVMKEVPTLIRRKSNQIEAFVNRRAEKFKKVSPTMEHCRLLTLELLFLWHSLPTCTVEELRPMLDVCDSQSDHKLLHLKCLIEGGIYRELGEEDMAINCLKETVARHQGMKDDYHVPAFAMFELAFIYMKTPELAGEAKSLLTKIKENFKDYDFENRLNVRVNNALQLLKNSQSSKPKS